MLHCPSLMCTCQPFFGHQVSSRRVVHTFTFTWLRNMVTTEEQSTYLAQQLNAMQIDVAGLHTIQGLATRYADLMVQQFTSEP